MEDEKEEVEETYMEDEKEGNDLDEEVDLEEILNELELEEAEDSKENTVDEAEKAEGDKTVDEAKEDDEDTVDEAKDDKEDLDEQRPIHKAEYANDPTYKADHVAAIAEDKDFDLDKLLEEINNLDESEEETVEEQTEETVEEQTEETNEVLGAAAGVAALVAAAGGLGALERAAEDPEWKAKYPKVASALEKLQSMGAAAGAAMRKEQEERDAELAETKEALTTIKSELNEVNLLNSKLLYVNRIFKANNLSESQKLKVVETLDKAESIKESKLIYETIKDTFNVANNKKGSIKKQTKSLKENFGLASKAAGTSTAPKKEIISESNDMVSRFQKLANIKINQ